MYLLKNLILPCTERVFWGWFTACVILTSHEWRQCCLWNLRHSYTLPNFVKWNECHLKMCFPLSSTSSMTDCFQNEWMTCGNGRHFEVESLSIIFITLTVASLEVSSMILLPGWDPNEFKPVFFSLLHHWHFSLFLFVIKSSNDDGESGAGDD